MQTIASCEYKACHPGLTIIPIIAPKVSLSLTAVDLVKISEHSMTKVAGSLGILYWVFSNRALPTATGLEVLRFGPRYIEPGDRGVNRTE